MKRYQAGRNKQGWWVAACEGHEVCVLDEDEAVFLARNLNTAYADGVRDGGALLDAERATVRSLQAEIAGLNSQLRDILSQAEIP